MVSSVVRDIRVLMRLAEKDGEDEMGRQGQRSKKLVIKTRGEKRIRIAEHIENEFA